jgi:cell division septation protein DedD
VSLLPESLPEDSTIIGPASVELTIGMHALAPETVFLVRLQERPEIRRVFPRRRAPELPAATAPFAIRIAWFGDAASGTVLVEELRTAGFAAYLVQPAGTTTNAGYEVRVGLFETQEAAEQEARVLEKRLGTNLRVITAR